MSAATRPVPDWKLERLLLEELPPDEQEALQQQLAEDPELAARLQALRDGNARILTAHPPARLASELARRSAAERALRREQRAARWRWTLGLGGPALAAAAALLLWIGPAASGDPTGPAGNPEATRQKGLRPHLQIVRRTAAGNQALASGDRAAGGDLLMLQVVGAGARHAAVLSLDGRGQVTAHLPEAGEQAVALPVDGALALPHAYELDDAPGYERFFLISAAQPFELAPVRAAVAALAGRADADRAPLALPEGLRQSDLLLRKEPR